MGPHPQNIDQYCFIIQKKILKAVTFSDMTVHSNLIFSKLGLLKVGNIFQLQLLSFMYDCYHGLAPSYFSSYFTPFVNMHHYDTSAASCGDLFLQKRTHLFMVSNQFNNLEQNCEILCLYQSEIHSLPQYLDHKLKP